MLCFNVDDQGEENPKNVYQPWRAHSDHSYIEEQVFAHPRLCTWRFITPSDAVYLKERLRDKRAILSFFEKVFPTDDIASLESDDGFFKMFAWKMFKSLRDESFTEKGISSALGLLYITHIFFLSSSKHSPEDVYKFFYDGVFLHTVLDPPECDEVFTVKECELLFQLFNNLYLQNVRLLHLKHFPEYYRTREESVAPTIQEEEVRVETPVKKISHKKKKKLHL